MKEGKKDKEKYADDRETGKVAMRSSNGWRGVGKQGEPLGKPCGGDGWFGLVNNSKCLI